MDSELLAARDDGFEEGMERGLDKGNQIFSEDA